MLISETSAAALLLTRFHDLARVPQKRARVPVIAHPWPKSITYFSVISWFLSPVLAGVMAAALYFLLRLLIFQKVTNCDVAVRFNGSFLH